MASPPARIVGQTPPSGTVVGSGAFAPGPAYGVVSDEPASPCIVAVPTGPAYGLIGSTPRGPSAASPWIVVPASTVSRVRAVESASSPDRRRREIFTIKTMDIDDLIETRLWPGSRGQSQRALLLFVTTPGKAFTRPRRPREEWSKPK